MSIQSIAYIFLISLSITLLSIHFRIWLSQKQDLGNLMFSLAALGAAMLAVLEMLSFKTNTIEEHRQFISLMHIPIFMLIVSITWFVRFYFKTGRLWLAFSISSLWIIGLVLNFIVGDNLTFIKIEGISEVQTFLGETTYIPYGQVNKLGNIVNLASILFVIYVIDATVSFSRIGNRPKAMLFGFSIVFFILVAGTIAPLVDYGIIKAAYMVSLPFAAILMAMSVQLSRDVIEMSKLSREVISKDERWSKLLREVKFLVVAIDSSGKAYYVNPYFLDLTGFSEDEVIGKDWINNFIPEQSRSALMRTFSLPQEKNFPRHFQNSILTKEGLELKVFWSIVRIDKEDGKYPEILAIGNNVTEREEAFDKVLELKQQLEVRYLALKKSFDDTQSVSNIVIKSDASKYAFQMAKEVAKVDTTVLLQGETGTGKGVYARFIHDQSKRKSQAFIQVNCAAIPSDLLESELFGFEKGAFTGATRLKKGRFELAEGGTLFLDEIGELPLGLQVKLLRVLQSGEFERLGSENTQKVNVRIITATNRVLADEVKKGGFREDLYYRINVFPITIPPLRKRKEDIPELLEYFTRVFQSKYEKQISGISKQTYDVLSKHNWPGNIRELQNVIERAVISSYGDTLRIEVLDGYPITQEAEPDHRESGPIKLDEVEKAHILKILDRVNWRIHGENGAADLLDINPSTLRSRMKKLDIRNKRTHAE